MRRSPDIAMLLENFPYPQDSRVLAEAESLAAEGWRLVVIAPRARGQPRREMIGTVEVRRFRQFQPSNDGIAGFVLEYLLAGAALHLAAARMLIRGTRALHLHNPPDIFFLAGAMFRAFGRKVVFDHHDLFPELLECKGGGRRWIRLARLSERLTFAAANHVLSTNQSYAEIALTRGGKQRGEVTVVRNGPPESWCRVPIKSRPADRGTVRLGYLGGLLEHEGVLVLPSVLARLRADGLQATLTIVGEGNERPTLAAEFERRGLAASVTFTGWVEWDQVPELLEEVDIGLAPAPKTEMNSRSTITKIAEYLALGKAVVAYDLCETRRTAGDAAVLVPPGDEIGFAAAIAALARDPVRRQALVEDARERAQQLTWPHSAQALLTAYERVLGRPAASRSCEVHTNGASRAQASSLGVRGQC